MSRRNHEDVPLDPLVSRFLEEAWDAGRRPFSEGTVAQARQQMALRSAKAPPGPPVHAVTDVTVRLTEGTMPARLYTPSERSENLLVYMHGGGWVLGTLDAFDATCRTLAHASGVRVLSVDYRLAPEHPFPVAVGDALAAVRWAFAGLAAGERIAVGGDSAGGNLAAVCAQLLRDDPTVDLAAALLIYPVLDCDFSRESYLAVTDRKLTLTAADMQWFWSHYLPEERRRSDPRASPLRHPEFAGLPPTLVAVAGHDPLREEAFDYAERLGAAGVPCRLLSYPSLAHGFASLVSFIPAAAEAVAEIGAGFAQMLTEIRP